MHSQELRNDIKQLRAAGFQVEEVERGVLEVFIGPQHPGSGHMRIILYVDGDIIVDADPDVGYVHRTMEKLAENREYIKGIPLLERMAILDAHNISLGYVLAIEKLLGIEPPPRAQYLRVLLSEINRIASHLYGMGIFGVQIGMSTWYMWAFGDREVFLELADRLTGQRLTHTYSIPGGVRRDLPQDFKDYALKAVRYMEKRLKEYKAMFLDNPVVRSRLIDVGVISKNKAVEINVVGPTLRGSGIKYDVRKVYPYAAYDEIDFEIAYRDEGDCYARTLVRVEEIKQSLNIIRQVVEKIPDGPIMHERFTKGLPPIAKKILSEEGRVKIPPAMIFLKLPKGKVFTRVEASRGEVVYYLESHGDTKPYRLRVVTPSAQNSKVFKYVLPGHRVADLPAIYGSIDYFPPETDR